MTTSSDKIQRILEKLQKLTALETSARELGNEGEANAAAAGINRLLLEYDLELQDVPAVEKKTDPVKLETVPFRFTYMNYPWYSSLISVCSKHNLCRAVRQTKFDSGKPVKSFAVVGRSKNREVTLYLISFLANKFLHIGRSRYSEYKLKYLRGTGCIPPTMAEFMKSFLQGCVNGLNGRLEKEKEDMP